MNYDLYCLKRDKKDTLSNIKNSLVYICEIIERYQDNDEGINDKVFEKCIVRLSRWRRRGKCVCVLWVAGGSTMKRANNTLTSDAQETKLQKGLFAL